MEQTLFDDIKIEHVKTITECPKFDYTCKKCPGKYFNQIYNICNSKEFFVNKNDHSEMVCKYNSNAVDFWSVYK